MSDPSDALRLRIRRFLAKPAKGKLESVTFRLRTLLHAGSSTISLPFGATWALRDSALDGDLRSGAFESAETAFAMRFLRQGMMVLDVGAHHGFYTLLASLRVGPAGRVIAFEPSPRERKRLKRHIKMNNCKNVRIEPLAVGASHGQATLFLVEGAEDYCNSLRPPVTQARTISIRVEVTSLDEYLSNEAIPKVNFIKLDVEGSELDALKGAVRLLATAPRPVLMVEVYDIRTEPWGYRAHEIVQFLSQATYEWFSLLGDGTPRAIEPGKDRYDANLVAVPREDLQSFMDSFRART